MNLPDNLLDDAWCWIAWAVWLPVFVRSVWRAPWLRFKDSEQFNVWLGMIVLLTLIWSLKAGVKPGLSMHLLGASVFTLCFGPALAFIGLSMVLLGITLNGAAGGFAFALNSLLVGGFGVLFSQYFYQAVRRFLPRHFFVYIFVNGFFAAHLSTIASLANCKMTHLATLLNQPCEWFFWRRPDDHGSWAYVVLVPWSLRRLQL